MPTVARTLLFQKGFILARNLDRILSLFMRNEEEFLARILYFSKEFLAGIPRTFYFETECLARIIYFKRNAYSS